MLVVLAQMHEVLVCTHAKWKGSSSRVYFPEDEASIPLLQGSCVAPIVDMLATMWMKGWHRLQGSCGDLWMAILAPMLERNQWEYGGRGRSHHEHLRTLLCWHPGPQGCC